LRRWRGTLLRYACRVGCTLNMCFCTPAGATRSSAFALRLPFSRGSVRPSMTTWKMKTSLQLSSRMPGGSGPIPVAINCAFDAGNIECVKSDDCTTAPGGLSTAAAITPRPVAPPEMSVCMTPALLRKLISAPRCHLPGIQVKVKDDPYTELEKKCHKQVKSHPPARPADRPADSTRLISCGSMPFSCYPSTSLRLGEFQQTIHACTFLLG